MIRSSKFLKIFSSERKFFFQSDSVQIFSSQDYCRSHADPSGLNLRVMGAADLPEIGVSIANIVAGSESVLPSGGNQIGDPEPSTA